MVSGFTSLWRRLMKDESGGEVMEYVLVAGLVVLTAIMVMSGVGTKVLARWTSVRNNS